MASIPRTVFCIGSASLVREVSTVAWPIARVRWAPDLSALRRALTGTHLDAVAACIVEANADAQQILTAVRAIAPAARRLAVADACDLRLVRSLLESAAAHELVYRPLDAATLSSALQITRSTGHAAVSRARATAPSRE